MLPRDGHVDIAPVLLRASFKAPSTFVKPPKHRGCQNAALAAAGGKLYLLGGTFTDEILAAEQESFSEPSRLEVFEPHTGAWYSASSPLPSRATLKGHALVANKAEGLLLALGGTAYVAQPDGAYTAVPGDVWDSGMVAKYDIREGATVQRWLKQVTGLWHETVLNVKSSNDVCMRGAAVVFACAIGCSQLLLKVMAGPAQLLFACFQQVTGFMTLLLRNSRLKAETTDAQHLVSFTSCCC
jgi:hypothetical protein